MPRKTKLLQDKLIKLSEEAELVNKSLEEEADKESKLIDDTKQEILKIAEAHNMFCGVILAKEDLIKIFTLALEDTTIKIPFNLYYNE